MDLALLCHRVMHDFLLDMPLDPNGPDNPLPQGEIGILTRVKLPSKTL
jgi:hypothetical protein